MERLRERAGEYGFSMDDLADYFVLPETLESVPDDVEEELRAGSKQIVSRLGRPVEERECMNPVAFGNVLLGAVLLARLGIVHGDISCGNVVMENDKLKMIDWSFAGFREEWLETGRETDKKRLDYNELRRMLEGMFKGITIEGPRNVLSL